MLLGVRLAALLVDVADRDDLAGVVCARRYLANVARQIGAAAAYADDADVDAVVGAPNAPGCSQPQRAGAAALFMKFLRSMFYLSVSETLF